MAATYQTVTTADGRQLEYLVTGDPAGHPVLFHYGTPNCATEFSALTKLATDLGIQLISYSRPGYATSTEQPGRSVADAVADVEAVLDAIGVDEFRTIGWSGGGPHALACAALLPRRCRAAAVLAGVAPYTADGLDFLAGMGEENIEEFGAALAGRDRLDGFLSALLPHFTEVTGESVAEGLAGLLPEIDRRALTGEFADEMAATFRRAMSRGIAGWRDDDLAFVADWGFSVTDISVPVAIWQGGEDRMVPFAHGQWLAARVPGAQPHLFADEGHLSLISQVDTILADLLELG